MKRLACITLLLSMVLIGCASHAEPNTESETQIMFSGSSTLAPVISSIAAEFNETFPHEPLSVFVASGGSGQGIRALIDQTADFGMLARSVRESERDEIPDMQEFLVAIDALTIAVHPDNPLLQIRNNLSSEELLRIFSGTYETWRDLDQRLPEVEIIVIVRDIGGGAHEVFQSTIMGEVDVKAEAIQAPSMGALVSRVMENRYAIGYASYGIANQNADSLAILQVDGIPPNTQTIMDGTYRIQRPLILVSSGELTAIQKTFLDVILGDRGQEIVHQMGFIRAH